MTKRDKAAPGNVCVPRCYHEGIAAGEKPRAWTTQQRPTEWGERGNRSLTYETHNSRILAREYG